MSALLAFAICAAVVWVLAWPFRDRAARGADRSLAEDAPQPRGDDTAALAKPAMASPSGHPSRAAVPGRAPSSTSDSVLSDSDPAASRPAADGHSELRDEKERLLTAIADLRFDFETGKLSPADYELEDTRLRRRAAEAIRSLEGR